jgi:hypothetical protein
MKNKIVLITICSLLRICFAQAQTKNGGIIVYENNGTGLLAAPKDLGLPCTYQESIEKCGGYVLNGFDNWRLPTKNELNLLYENRNKIGGFDMSYVYWSSTSDGSVNTAWYIDFNDGTKEFGRYDYGTSKVRCVRSFNVQEKDVTVKPPSQLMLDSTNHAYINSLIPDNTRGVDYSQVQGVYRAPYRIGDGDNPQQLFFIISKNGVVLRGFGTDVFSAFSGYVVVTNPQNVRFGQTVSVSTEKKLQTGQIGIKICFLSGEKVIFKDNDEVDSYHLDRSNHRLIWDDGIHPNGNVKPSGWDPGLDFIAPFK